MKTELFWVGQAEECHDVPTARPAALIEAVVPRRTAAIAELPSPPRAVLTTRPRGVREALGDIRAMRGNGCSSSSNTNATAPGEATGPQPSTPMRPPLNAPSHSSASKSPPGTPPHQTPGHLRSAPCPGPAPGPAPLLPEPLRHSGPLPPTQPGPRPRSSRPGAGPAPRKPSTDHPTSRRGPTRPESNAEDAVPSRARPGATPPAPHSPPPWPGASGGGGWGGGQWGGRGERGTRMWRRPLIGCGATRAGGAAEARRGGRTARGGVRGQRSGGGAARSAGWARSRYTVALIQSGGPVSGARGELRTLAGRSGQNLSLNHGAVIKAAERGRV